MEKVTSLAIKRNETFKFDPLTTILAPPETYLMTSSTLENSWTSRTILVV